MHNVIQPAPRWVKNVPMIYVGGATATGGSAINVVSGVQNGDLLVMAVVASSSLSNVSGWTLRREYTEVPYIKVYSRVASSEPATYSTGYSSSGGLAAVMVAYRNATGVNVTGTILREDQPSGGGGNTTIVAPSLTATASGRLLAIYFRARSSATLSTSTVSGMSAKAGTSHLYITDRYMALRIFDKAQIIGLSGDKTANVASGNGGWDFGMQMQIY